MSINIAYAGDREIAVDILTFIIDNGVKPRALFVPPEKEASHNQELINMCNHLENSDISEGDEFRTDGNIKRLKDLDLDYIISIHFPYIYPKSILDIPKHGIINLHPAYLPFNRGWHTPTWAIYEGTPYGATLHFMDEDLDSGDIITRKKIEKKQEDTAHTLYQKALKLEKKLFKESWEDLVNFEYNKIPQDLHKGTRHTKEDIKKIQKVELEEKIEVKEFIKKLRALTTNKLSEAAYFQQGEDKYRIQINIEED